MFLDVILKIKINKSLVVLLSITSIVTFWYIEKAKRIPQYGIVLYEMGLSCEDECGQDKQLKYFQRAVRYDSKLYDTYYAEKLSDAHYRSALIYEEMGDHAKSLESLMRAIELYQLNTLAYYGIGLHYFKEGAYEYARRYFLQATKSRIGIPDDTKRYLARIYDYLKKYDLAVSYYCDFVLTNAEYAPEIYPRVAEIYYLYLDENAIMEMLHVMRHWKHYALADQLEQYFEAIKFSKTSSVLPDNN